MSTKYHTNFSGGNFWEGEGAIFLGCTFAWGGVTVPHPEEIWGQKVLTGMLYTSYNKMSNALILV